MNIPNMAKAVNKHFDFDLSLLKDPSRTLEWVKIPHILGAMFDGKLVHLLQYSHDEDGNIFFDPALEDELAMEIIAMPLMEFKVVSKQGEDITVDFLALVNTLYALEQDKL